MHIRRSRNERDVKELEVGHVRRRKKAPTKSTTESHLVDGVLDLNEAAEVIPFNYAIAAYRNLGVRSTI